ncbi:hypothetical protein RUM44_007284 [Polyplax serrata]|uniref:Nucleolar protein 9 n=1 Tax=Polyplax serrata TaxID=468196 RepID=A0ABR1B0R1_POLSC
MLATESTETERHGKRKKKKRSFLQAQKRYAKKGSFGRGTQLSQDMYDYFINIMKVMNTKKDDEDEMRVLASNILTEIDGKESDYCCNQIISRAMENLLPFTDDEEFCNFIEKFGENLRPIFSDTFGSHVLQQSLIVAYTKYQKCVADEDSEKKLNIKFYTYIMKISNFLFNNFDEFVWDVYSNAIARTVFNVLSGNPVKGEVKPSSSIKMEDEVKFPDEFKSLLHKFAKRILSFPQFEEFCNDQIQSGLLQSLLVALGNSDECYELIDKIIFYYGNNQLDLSDAANTPFIRLVEGVLSVANKSYLKKVYKVMLKENLVELSKSKSGNFAIQKLIGNCNSKKMFGKIFAKLESEMEEILNAGNSGVLLAVVKACGRLEICQGACMTMLSKTFHMKDNKDIVPTLSLMTPAENVNFEEGTFNIHGCLVIQEILGFRKPGNVVRSLLDMTESNVVKLLCDTKGCHITDAYIKGQYVGEKNKDKLFKKLQGHYLELATSKHGSRSLDAIWSVTGVQQKALLADELKLNQSNLYASVYGKNFAWKIHLDNFRRNKEEWMKVFKTSETAEKYFADILPPKRQKTS